MASPLTLIPHPMGQMASCQFTIPRRRDGKWTGADHITILLPKGMLHSPIRRGQQLKIEGELNTFVSLSPMGVRHLRTAILCRRLAHVNRIDSGISPSYTKNKSNRVGSCA
ncbi:MAG: hypothetical protein E7328_04055 [Clostridiales bacterium]|nr:hypothetical protein [Clostridiales bacterium]